MLKLIAGVGLLVAHDTFLAELHVLGQAVVGFELVLRDVRGVLAVVNVDVTGNLSIFFTLQSALYQNKRRRPIANAIRRRLCRMGIL